MRKFLKYIICILIIVAFPFIFPLITRFLIHIQLYTDIKEFKRYIEIFFNWYFILLLFLGVISVYFIVCDKDKLIRWLEKRNFLVKYKDTSIESKSVEMIDESDKKKKFVDNLNSDNKIDPKSIIQEMKEELKDNKKRKKASKEINIEEIQNENNNLRFYSAYNIINKKTKELLNIIYFDKSMKLELFKSKLIDSFKSRNKKNKNLTKAQINVYAINKYETIKEGLQYLNIIEISDDDKTITLTQYGKEFVEKYIEKEVRDNEN
jgi:hypothetical protein